MHFHPHDLDTAPEASRPTMRAVTNGFGYLPTPVALMSESPELLQAFVRGNALFEKSSLTALQRETVVMTIATRTGCHVCVAMHTATLTRADTSADIVMALRDRTPLPDPHLEALRTFTLAVLDSAGSVSDAHLDEFLGHGFSTRNALDVVLGVGTYTLSTFANRMTNAPLDAPLAAFAWEEQNALHGNGIPSVATQQ